MRAYKACDVSNDGFIDEKEFKNLVGLLRYYNELFLIFKKLDRNSDKRISFEEFVKGHSLLNIKVQDKKQLQSVFNKIDTNGGGMILFDEFCIFMAKQKMAGHF